eukprot:scaffold3713_cov372-Prasinococcus_capsulatus_cf.AAC.7
MSLPDMWIDILKNTHDEDWHMNRIVGTLCNRRRGPAAEKVVAYAESHDQSIVGDKTIAFWLMDQEMYDGMSTLTEPPNPVIIQRGMSLHKMIRLITIGLGGEGYLSFMGNEFGHPEWIDFPREGNDWSHDYCRRRFDLADRTDLRYHQLQFWEESFLALEEETHFMSDEHLLVSEQDEEKKVIVFERANLVFVFNFHPADTYEKYKVGVREPGRYRLVLDSDGLNMGGEGRVPHDWIYFSDPEGIPGEPETNFNDRPQSITLEILPSRTCQVYTLLPEDDVPQQAAVSDYAAAPAMSSVTVEEEDSTTTRIVEHSRRVATGSYWQEHLNQGQ